MGSETPCRWGAPGLRPAAFYCRILRRAVNGPVDSHISRCPHASAPIVRLRLHVFTLRWDLWCMGAVSPAGNGTSGSARQEHPCAHARYAERHKPRSTEVVASAGGSTAQLAVLASAPACGQRCCIDTVWAFALHRLAVHPQAASATAPLRRREQNVWGAESVVRLQAEPHLRWSLCRGISACCAGW